MADEPMPPDLPPVVHTFDDSNAAGLRGEARVFAHLEAAGYHVRRVGMADQWKGVDAVVTNPAGATRRVEVKSDAVAWRTHRGVVETVSNDRTGRPGWVHTTTADLLHYLVERDDVLYWLDPATLRANLPEWERRAERGGGNFRTFAANNGHYRTLGILVPLTAFEAVAVRVESL